MLFLEKKWLKADLELGVGLLEKHTMLLDFGKYKGEALEDVPLQYMIFLAGYRMVGAQRVRANHISSQWIDTYKPQFHALAREHLANQCWHCGTKLVPIGSARMNGAPHEEWDGRYLHKTCWRQLKQEEQEL